MENILRDGYFAHVYIKYIRYYYVNQSLLEFNTWILLPVIVFYLLFFCVYIQICFTGDFCITREYIAKFFNIEKTATLFTVRQPYPKSNIAPVSYETEAILL